MTLTNFFAGEVPWVLVEPDGRTRCQSPLPPVLLSGSFNPLHLGHLYLAEIGRSKGGGMVGFELCIRNVDKPDLSMEEVDRRLRQFCGRHPVIVSKEPTFLGKSRLFPRTTFLVGYDTAERIIAPRYYGGDEVKMQQALAEIAQSQCQFLVAGRIDGNDRFLTLQDLSIPKGFQNLFESISPDEFRLDLSSTTIRMMQDRDSKKG